MEPLLGTTLGFIPVKLIGPGLDILAFMGSDRLRSIATFRFRFFELAKKSYGHMAV